MLEAKGGGRNRMETWIANLIEQYGYFGILLLITLENIFPPIPSEVILMFGGFMTTKTSLSVLGVAVVATTGSIVGSLMLYGIGRMFSMNRLERIIERKGVWMRLKKEDVQKANNWIKTYGYWAVVICRMIPLIRSLISIPAGMAHMRLTPFLLFTCIGTFIWNITMVGIGAIVGENWDFVKQLLSVYATITYALIAAIALLIIIFFLRRARRKQV